MKLKIYFNRHNDRPCAILLEGQEILVDKLAIHVSLASKYLGKNRKQPVFYLEGEAESIKLWEVKEKIYAEIS